MVSSELLYTTLLSCSLTVPNQTDLESHILERVDNPPQLHPRPSTPVNIPLLDFESPPAVKPSSPSLPRSASGYVPLDVKLPSKASSSYTPYDPLDAEEDHDGVDDYGSSTRAQTVRDAVRSV